MDDDGDDAFEGDGDAFSEDGDDSEDDGDDSEDDGDVDGPTPGSKRQRTERQGLFPVYFLAANPGETSLAHIRRASDAIDETKEHNGWTYKECS